MSPLKTLPTALDYNSGKGIIPEGAIRISASGIGNFFSYTRNWWGDNFLGEQSFSSSSASVNGTLVHFVLEQFTKHQSISDADKTEIANYILKHTNPEYLDYNPDIDINYIESQYKPMAEAIVNDYLQHNMPTHVEPFITHEVLPNIYCGGSIDGLILESPRYKGTPTFENLISSTGGTIVDYKTSGVFHTSLPKPTDPMKFSYKLQLLTYAWVLRQRGITVDRIRLVYVSKQEIGRMGKPDKKGVSKPLTDYPSKVSVQTVQLTEDDFTYIEGIIHLVAESIQYWLDHPEARYILAQDYRLKA